MFSETFNTINNITIDVLSLKGEFIEVQFKICILKIILFQIETYNTELGSSAAMVFALVNMFDENKTKRSFVRFLLFSNKNSGQY